VITMRPKKKELSNDIIGKVLYAKEELEILVDSISDIFLLLCKDGKVCRTNQAIESWGLKRVTETKQLDFHQIFHPNCTNPNCHIPVHWEIAQEKIQDEPFFEYSVWDDILNRHLLVKYLPVNTARYPRIRCNVYTIAIFQDISQLKKAERNTARSSEELKAILYASPDQHIRICKDGTILSENYKKIRENALPTPDFSKGNILNCLPEDVAEIFRKRIAAIPHEKDKEIFEYSLSLGNSEQFFEARLFPIFEDHILLINRNITEKKRLASIAESVNYMKTLGYLFSGIRHEMGNPINSIKMSLLVLKKNMMKLTPDRVMEYIDRSLGEVNRMEFLLQSFKNFNLYENVVFSQMPLTPFLENFFTLMVDDFKSKGVQLFLWPDPTATTVYSNARALHQVLLNVVGNSLDALQEINDPVITVKTTKVKGFIQIKIADNGVGIHESLLENLFKPFYTTKLNGTGLGLVIVKKIVTRLAGKVRIESNENEGTTVIISLPEKSSEEIMGASID
jgi:signal transduction histidine kinase